MTGIVAMAIAALIQVESAGNPRAQGDGGRAVGILQMWPIAVAEANRIAGARRWTPADRENPDKSREMAATILGRHYRRGVRNPVDLAARWRNPKGNAPEWYRQRLRAAMEGTR